MKQSYLMMLVLGLGMVLSGCPYGADVPIDGQPSIPVDKNVLGKWENKSVSDYVYYFRAASANEYRISKISTSTGDSTVYFAFESNVDNVRFVNIYEDNDYGSKTYYLYKMTVQGDSKITMEEVTDNIDEKFDTSADLRAYLSKHDHLSFMYNKDPDEYIRVK